VRNLRRRTHPHLLPGGTRPRERAHGNARPRFGTRLRAERADVPRAPGSVAPRRLGPAAWTGGLDRETWTGRLGPGDLDRETWTGRLGERAPKHPASTPAAVCTRRAREHARVGTRVTRRTRPHGLDSATSGTRPRGERAYVPRALLARLRRFALGELGNTLPRGTRLRPTRTACTAPAAVCTRRAREHAPEQSAPTSTCVSGARCVRSRRTLINSAADPVLPTPCCRPRAADPVLPTPCCRPRAADPVRCCWCPRA
jgi:hypothetical protein